MRAGQLKWHVTSSLNCYYLLSCMHCAVPFTVDRSSQGCIVSHTTLGQSVCIVWWGHIVIWKIIQFAGEDSRPESGNVICSLSAVFGEKSRGSTLCCLGNTGKISTDWKCISSHIMLAAKNEFDNISFYKIVYIKCATHMIFLVSFTNHLCGWQWIVN